MGKLYYFMPFFASTTPLGGWLLSLFQRVPYLREWMWGQQLLLLCVVLITSILGFWIVRMVALQLFTLFAKRTPTQWDDMLLRRKVVHYLAHIALGAFVYWLTLELFPYEEQFCRKLLLPLARVYMVLALVRSLDATLRAAHDIYQTTPLSRELPLRPFVQVLQILVYFVGIIVAIALLLGKNPASIFVGLGAMAAVLMLVFQDTILGLVASIQASTSKMVKPGDWIEMPSRQADGTVLEIMLNTVKVRNWDLSITTFPTYALVKESFKNYKGLDEAGGRQIARAILLDLSTVTFYSHEQMHALLSRFPLLESYVGALEEEEPAYPGAPSQETTVTNLALFRHYVLYYLRQRPELVEEHPCTVRLLAPTPKGVPLQVYCYLKYPGMVNFDAVQTDIFEHLYAVVPLFGLRMYQDGVGVSWQES